MRTLLADGHINGHRRPHHFAFVMEEQKDVERTLRNLGMVLVIDTTMQIIYARNMTDNECDRYADKQGCDPIQPIANTRRLTFWETVAALHFRGLIDQEVRQGGVPIWLTEEDACEALAVYAGDAAAEDKTAAHTRVQRTLQRLVDLNLVEKNTSTTTTRYKGHPLLRVAITRDQTTAFTQKILATIANTSPTAPCAERPAQ